MTIVSTAPPAVRPRLPRPNYASWQEAMKDAIRCRRELLRLLDLPANDLDPSPDDAGFPLFVPRGYVARMHPGDVNDPLLRQVLPVSDEARPFPGFVSDPVNDAAARRQPGLLQKYAGRALLVASGVCAIHCRYCFRRHYPYDDTPHTLASWQPALQEIGSDTSLREVILSGGDPLALVDAALAQLVHSLDRIRHLRRLRIHTRLPVVIPERVTEELIAILRGLRLAPVVVLHANHARELDRQVALAVAKLSTVGVVLLNQAVLLRGVNDSVEAQADLCQRLIDLRIVPYYLHQLDPVAGAAHFEVPVERGRQIVAELKRQLPGYAVPRYVREVAGEASKFELMPG